jgi:hypothetical protein
MDQIIDILDHAMHNNYIPIDKFVMNLSIKMHGFLT